MAIIRSRLRVLAALEKDATKAHKGICDIRMLRPQNQELRMLFENGETVSHAWSGSVFRVNVPGYGLIFAETGRAKFVWGLDEDGQVYHYQVFNAGHNQFRDEDVEALCNALK